MNAEQFEYPPDRRCIYTQLSDGTHLFEFMDGSFQAIDEWLYEVDALYAGKAPFDTVRYLVDCRIEGRPAISYAARSVRRWLHKHPHYARTRIALIYDNSLLLTMLREVVEQLNIERLDLRFFPPEHWQQALEWLRQP